MPLSRALLFTRASGNGLSPHPAEAAGLVLVRLCCKERGKDKSLEYTVLYHSLRRLRQFFFTTVCEVCCLEVSILRARPSCT